MKNLFYLAFFSISLFFSGELNAQQFSGMDKSPADIASFPRSNRVSKKTARIIYSRPQLKGRDINTLAEPGKVWRTGANEATEITFYTDATIDGQKVKAGTYSLFTIPGDGEWTVILNENLNQWGAYTYDSEADVARFKAKAGKDVESLEAFSITFNETDGGGADLVLGWDTTRVTLPMSFTTYN